VIAVDSSMTAYVFWLSVACVVYAYAGYPLVLMILARLRNRPVTRAEVTPRVTFIIAARNEQRRIRRKIENTLGQDYPAGKLEIIIASDCSTDETDAIAREFPDRVRLVRSPERRGKEAAQKLAIRASAGDVLIFSDAATLLAPDGVSSIVRSFADPAVGAVSSTDGYLDAAPAGRGEAAYLRYEMALRVLESRVFSVVGLSGSFFAVRREVCRFWSTQLPSDFNVLLRAVELGFRGVVDPESVGYYAGIADHRDESPRKIRTVVRGIAALAANRRMLNPFRYGLFAWQLASHKLCRWLVPFFLIMAAAANALLAAGSTFYLTMLVLEFGFYAAALAGIRTGATCLRIPAFLASSNLAVLAAWIRYLRGDRVTWWDPSERPATAWQPAVR